ARLLKIMMRARFRAGSGRVHHGMLVTGIHLRECCNPILAALVAVGIQHCEPDTAQCNTGHGLGKNVLPPCADLRLVAGRALLPSFYRRSLSPCIPPLSKYMCRENRNARARELERSFKVSLSMALVVQFPPLVDSAASRSKSV